MLKTFMNYTLELLFFLNRESASPRQGVDHGSFYFCKKSLTEYLVRDG